MMIPASVLLLWATLAASIKAFSASANNNVAVYWGQNSYGNQERLSYYCDLDSVDIVILSFVTGFPSLSLNFANQCSDSFSDGLLHCSTIGEDITTCQEKGKLVLLSLGGSSGSYGFSSDSEAEEFATTLWNKFGGGSDSERPFDSAIVDGFDFDLENNDDVGTVALGNKLRLIFDTDTSKTYYLSAAPQCPYPDASTGEMLANVDMDFAFIQFYNNYCNLGTQFNWDTWKTYAEETSPNKNIKMYVGLPGASSSAGSGFVSLDTVEEYVTSDILDDANFGGFMLWDASSGVSNVNSAGESFVDQLKGYMDGNEADTTSTSTSTTSTSTTSTTSSTSTTPTTSSTSTTPTTSSTSTTPTTSSTSTTSTSSTASSTIASTTSTATLSSSTSTSSTSTSTEIASTTSLASSTTPSATSTSVTPSAATSSTSDVVLSSASDAETSPSTSEVEISSAETSAETSAKTSVIVSSSSATQSSVSPTQLSVLTLLTTLATTSSDPAVVTDVLAVTTVTVQGSVITHWVTQTHTVATRYITVTYYGSP